MNLRQCFAGCLVLFAARSTTLRAQAGTCFYGPIRAACSGFFIFEGSAVVSGGSQEHTSTIVVPELGTGTQMTLVNRFKDLPGFYSGSLGYLRVVSPRTALGAVAELGFSNTSDLGNAHRVAITLRQRHQFSDATFDVGAGPLGVQVFTPSSGSCCTAKTNAYGATVESALMYRGLVGMTAGADLIHGVGRTSAALHAGVRVGSYGAVAAAIVTAAAGAFSFYALSHSTN